MIADTPVNLAVWQRQREVQQRKQQADLLELGFSTFFLNRTNRSGIPYKEAAPFTLMPHLMRHPLKTKEIPCQARNEAHNKIPDTNRTTSGTSPFQVVE